MCGRPRGLVDAQERFGGTSQRSRSPKRTEVPETPRGSEEALAGFRDQVSAQAKDQPQEVTEPDGPTHLCGPASGSWGALAYVGTLPHCDWPMWLEEGTSGGEQSPLWEEQEGQWLGKETQEGNGRGGTPILL